jgi:hypothetical protein
MEPKVHSLIIEWKSPLDYQFHHEVIDALHTAYKDSGPHSPRECWRQRQIRINKPSGGADYTLATEITFLGLERVAILVKLRMT